MKGINCKPHKTERDDCTSRAFTSTNPMLSECEQVNKTLQIDWTRDYVKIRQEIRKNPTGWQINSAKTETNV